MAVISWGKPKVFIKDLDTENAPWTLMPDAVQDSTTLETTKGDKVEAKVEGGENEDVRYNKSTYVLNLAIRITKGRAQPIEANDGLVAHNYAVLVQPEDATIAGIYIPKTEVSCEDTWTSADGGQWKYAFDALKPPSGNQVQWGVIAATAGTGSSAGTYTCTFDNTSV